MIDEGVFGAVATHLNCAEMEVDGMVPILEDHLPLQLGGELHVHHGAVPEWFST